MGSGKKMVNIEAFLLSNVIALSVFLALSALPKETYACGIFDIFSCFKLGDKVEAEQIDTNSQNIALLEATISPDQDNSSTTEGVSIVEGTSLASEPVVTIDNKPENDQISLYVVHSGDTLPAIAKMFGVTVNTIKWANDLSGNTVSVGQTLVILPISGVKYAVKSGDTLSSIAKKYKGDLDEILQYNNLSKNAKLAVGDIVIIPDGEAPSVSGSTSVGSSSGSSSSYPVYVGYYMRPIIGGIKTQGIHGHNGVDLASSYGSSILAAADGTVIISRNSGWNGGYGSYIVIKHGNGTQTLYAHLSATLVEVGDNVHQGQLIGRMGHSGQVNGKTGTHLHFEIRGAKNPF
jgi:LysM repeat protein